jgi:hypothetical protein
LQDPISKKPFTKKRTGGVAQGVGPSTQNKKKLLYPSCTPGRAPSDAPVIIDVQVMPSKLDLSLPG